MKYIKVVSEAEISSKSDKTICDKKILFFEWLSTEEAAAYLKISVNALRICVHRGQVKAHKFGRRTRFKVDELRDLLLEKGV